MTNREVLVLVAKHRRAAADELSKLHPWGPPGQAAVRAKAEGKIAALDALLADLGVSGPVSP